MPFHGPLLVEILPDGVNVTVLIDFKYTDSKGRDWVAPQGLVSDGASIPRELWASVGSPFTGKYRRAAILHDSAYRSSHILKDDADAMLREAAIEDGCPSFLADLIYEGVHVGGASSFTFDQQVYAARSAGVVPVAPVAPPAAVTVVVAQEAVPVPS